MTASKRALIVDDHALVRKGILVALNHLGEFTIYEAATKSEAMAGIATYNPQLLIVDINLPDGSGLEVVQWARSLSNEIAIVVLTFNDEDEFLIAAMQAGASSFVNKSAPLDELIAALEFSLKSPHSFSAKDIVATLQRRQQRFNLSPRELQVLVALEKGSRLNELASALYISESTLKTHLSSIYRKLGVKNQVQALNVARKAGLLRAGS
jgi:two-component system, NarL family, response regulator DevR